MATKLKKKGLTRKQLLRLAFIAFILGNSPDLDIIPAMLNPEHWKEIHREWGHNMFSLAVWITLGTFALRRFVSPLFNGALGWFVSAPLVLSHVLFDAMGDFAHDGARIGVPLLWPLSDWEFNLPFSLFRCYEVQSGMNPLLAHITSESFWKSAVFSEIAGSLLLFGIWFAALTVVRVIRKMNPRNPTVGAEKT